MEFTFCDRFHRIPIFQPQGDPLGVVSVAVDEKIQKLKWIQSYGSLSKHN